jgi:molybdate transport repressor ModE-like protein
MVSALIIAAGKTARRDNFDPQKEVGTIPAIQRVVMVFQRAGIERIVVVCDESGDRTEKLAANMNVIFLYSRKDAEMLDSIKTGLVYLQNKCTGVMITHTDIPLFSVETVRALMAADGEIRIPSHNGNIGHPMFLRAECFPAILSYCGSGGLAGAVETSDFQRRLVDVEDEGVLTNVHYKKKKAYEHLVAGHNLMQLTPDIRIRLVREKPFYGPGAHQLLQLTEEMKSVREACRRMGISYSKGRGIIAIIEQQLGYPVIKSQQGGKTGGHSTVNQKGRELISSYAGFCAEARQYIQGLFDKYFTA